LNYLKGTRSEDEETMEGPFGSGEKRNHPRIIIDLPVEYRDISDPCSHGHR